jgi:cytoskeletal protein CcmA (bactofilin family)
MFSREPKQSARIDTLIGKAARVQGDVEFEGGLHLDGRVAGNVRAVGPPGASLSVSEHGSIEGSVEVPNVTLNGSVRGDIRATERVILGPQARVHGNVHYGVIEMTLGAEIKGKLVPLPSGATATTMQSESPAAAIKSG